MIDIRDDFSCCGLNEIDGIRDDENKNHPERTVIEVAKQFFSGDKKCAFMIFTDIKRKKAGKTLEAYLRRNKLGTVTKSMPAINPNSKNSLTVWVWKINKKKLETYKNKEIIYEDD